MKKRIVSLLLALCLLAGLLPAVTPQADARHQHRHRHQSENVYLARQGWHIRLQERERV